MKYIILLSILINSLYANPYYYVNNKKVYLYKIENKDHLIRNTIQNNSIVYYKTKNNNTVGINNKILIKIKNNCNIEQLLLKYNLILIKEIIKNIYLIQINNKSDIFKIMNNLYFEKCTKYAHPNFIRKIYKR